MVRVLWVSQSGNQGGARLVGVAMKVKVSIESQGWGQDANLEGVSVGNRGIE